MRLHDDLVVLALAVARNGQTAVFNLSLITDAAQGSTLVDTGVSGQASAITALLAELGVELRSSATTAGWWTKTPTGSCGGLPRSSAAHSSACAAGLTA